MKRVAPWFFRSVFADQANVCFVKPNVSKNEIYVKITRDDPVRIVTMDEFIRLFVNHVMRKHFPTDYEGFGEYDNWLFCDQFIELSEEWDGQTPDVDPDFMIEMRTVIKEFLAVWPDKTRFKNMLLKAVYT